MMRERMSLEKDCRPPGDEVVSWLIGALLLGGLYVSSLYNYLLFHSLAEVFSIVVAASIFMLAWNARRFMDSDWLLFLGIGYLFIGFIDLIHTLGYTGMPFFSGYDTNLPTQLWIAARCMESLTLLAFPLFFRRRLRPTLAFTAYTAVTGLALASIFYWDVFPTCFVEGSGLTPFKRISEYVISMILLASIGMIVRHRDKFGGRVFRLLVASIAVTIASELAFTFYVSADGVANLVGHFLKIVSFYLIYRALIVAGLLTPYGFLFRSLTKSEEQFRCIFDEAPIGIDFVNTEGRPVYVNRALQKMLGYDEDELRGMKFADFTHPDDREPSLKLVEELREGKSDHLSMEKRYLRKDGSLLWAHTSVSAVRDANGVLRHFIAMVEDVTDRKQAEDAYRAVVDHSLQGLVIFGDSAIIFANNSFAAMTGYTVEELLAMPPEQVQALFHPDDLEMVLEHGKKRLAGEGVPEDYEVRGIRKDGSTIWVEAYCVLIEHQGQPAVQVTAIDITRRKQAEGELERSLSLLKDLQRMAKVGGWEIALLSGSGKWTDEVYRIHEVPLDYQPSPEKGIQFYPKEVRSKIEKAFQDLIEKGEPYDLELPFVTAKNNRRWVRTTARAVTTKGRIVRVFGNIVDITERREAEMAVVAEQNKAREYLQLASVLFVALDTAGIVTLINRKGCEILGYEGKEIVGKNWFENFLPDRDRTGIATVFRRLLEGDVESDENFENSVLTKSGEERIIAWHNLVLKDAEGQIVGTLSSGDDVTERNRVKEELLKHRNHLREMVAERTAELSSRIADAEQVNKAMANLMEDLQITNERLETTTHELKEANQELDAFSYSVSHDLRAPLRHIAGFVDLLKESSAESLGSTGQRQLNIIAESAERMGRLIDDLLAFSRAGRVELHKTALDLEQLVRGAVREVMEQTQDREVDWQIARLPEVRADQAMLRQVLVNLVDNAVKYTREREQTHIEVGMVPGEENELVVFVRDNGAGFDMRYVNKLFGVFQRLHSAEEYEGTGVGLANVRRIIRRHGGRTWAEGKVDEGATFYFSLPVERET